MRQPFNIGRRIILSALLSVLLLSSQQTVAQKQVRKWEIFEITLTAKQKYANPYAEISVNNPSDGLVKAAFTGINGDAKGKSLSLVGFWCGGQTWKVRFVAPESGTWEYKSISADKGLNNVKGRIEVVDWPTEEKTSNPTRRGFVQVTRSGPQAGHYFQYADGTPFLWVGDTWWNWTQKKIKFETFKTLVVTVLKKVLLSDNYLSPQMGGEESPVPFWMRHIRCWILRTCAKWKT